MADLAEEVEEEIPAEAAEEEEESDDESAEEEQEEEVAEDVPAPAKKKQTAQERIDEVIWQRKEKEREIEYWKKVALEKSAAAETVAVAPQPEAELPVRPRLEQFETTEAYEDALFEWRDNVRSTQAAQIKQKANYETAVAKFDTNADRVRKEHPDFDEVVENPVFSSGMKMALINSDNGPELAYFLGSPKNVTLANKIRNLPIQQQIYEMGKLEAKVIAVKSVKKVSSTPAPMKGVGLGDAGGETDTSKMTTAQWMEWDKQKRLAKLKQQYGT